MLNAYSVKYRTLFRGQILEYLPTRLAFSNSISPKFVFHTLNRSLTYLNDEKFPFFPAHQPLFSFLKVCSLKRFTVNDCNIVLLEIRRPDWNFMLHFYFQLKIQGSILVRFQQLSCSGRSLGPIASSWTMCDNEFSEIIIIGSHDFIIKKLLGDSDYITRSILWDQNHSILCSMSTDHKIFKIQNRWSWSTIYVLP